MVSAIAIFIIAINVYIYLKNKKDKQDEKRYSRFIKNSRATSTIQIEAVVSSATVSNLKKRKTSKETSIKEHKMFKFKKKPLKVKTNKLVVKINLFIVSFEWHIEFGQ